MLSLPELRLGDRIIRLPLSPLGTVDVVNTWTTADAGERQSCWRKLLEREHSLWVWASLVGGSSRVGDESRPHSASAADHCSTDGMAAAVPSVPELASRCDRHLLAAYARGPATSLAVELAAFSPEHQQTLLEAIARWTDAFLSTDEGALERAEGDSIPSEQTTTEQVNTEDSPLSDRIPVSRSIDLHALARRLTNPAAANAIPASDKPASDELSGGDAPRGSLEQAKLAALREFAYGLSHEINNPLANIATRAQTLLRDEQEIERRRSLSVIAQQAMRAHTMIADLMLFAKPPAPRKALVDPYQLVAEVAAELRDWASAQNTQLALRVRETPSDGRPPRVVMPAVEVDEQQWRVALRSLATNALEALGTGGCVALEVMTLDSGGDVAAGSHDAKKGAAVRFVVRDNGPGIPAAARPHLFDPYYSGREAGRGLGIGLCKAWRIVTDHGGTIHALDAPGGGAEFHIDIPVFSGAEAARVGAGVSTDH